MVAHGWVKQQQQQALMNHFRISFLNIVTKMPVTIATEPATTLAVSAMSLTLREELECGEAEGEVELEGEDESEDEGELELKTDG